MEPTNQEEDKMEEGGCIGTKAIHNAVEMLKELNDTSFIRKNGESNTYESTGSVKQRILLRNSTDKSHVAPENSIDIKLTSSRDNSTDTRLPSLTENSVGIRPQPSVENCVNSDSGENTCDFDTVFPRKTPGTFDISHKSLQETAGTLSHNRVHGNDRSNGCIGVSVDEAKLVHSNDCEMSMPELERIDDASIIKNTQQNAPDSLRRGSSDGVSFDAGSSNSGSLADGPVPISHVKSKGSEKPTVRIPKARKSCQPIKAASENTIKTVNLMPIINYKLKIPDIENALRKKEQHLEQKRLEALKKSEQPVVKKYRPSSPKAEILPLSPKVSPCPKTAVANLKVKIAERSKRNRKLYWKRGVIHRWVKPKAKNDDILYDGEARKVYGTNEISPKCPASIEQVPPDLSSRGATMTTGCPASNVRSMKVIEAETDAGETVTYTHKTMVSLLTSQTVARDPSPSLTSEANADASPLTTPSVPVSIPRSSLTAPRFRQDPLKVKTPTILDTLLTTFPGTPSPPTSTSHDPHLDVAPKNNGAVFPTLKPESVPPSPACSSKSSLEGGNSAKQDYLPLTPDSQVVLTAEEETLQEPIEVYSRAKTITDAIPLCTCKITTTMSNEVTPVAYCQAVDSVDGKVIGCCNKATNRLMLRPSVKIPFMSMCELHKSRVRAHQCCPGCGQFCTQGKFYQCSRDGFRSAVHSFHKQCQTMRNDRYYCPHCGQESEQFEVDLSLSDPYEIYPGFNKPDRLEDKPEFACRAKISIHESSYLQDNPYPPIDATLTQITLPNGKTVSSARLAYCAERYKLEKVLALLHGERPKKYRTLPKSLMGPINDGDLEKSVYMIADGHDPNKKFDDCDGYSALHLAAMGGHLGIVHLLVQAGAEVNQTDKQLKTACMYAAEYDHKDVLSYLIKANANLKAKAADGMTCLHIAAMKGNLSCIKVLLDSRLISVNIQDEGGWTPIIWATEHKYSDAVRLLLKFGADPNIKDQEENTALHWSAYSGSVDIAEMYLNAGSDVEAVNHNGERPLHIAARQDYYECVVLFLARGAEVNVLNKSQKDPVSLCLDQTSDTYRSLLVSQSLRKVAETRLIRVEKLVHRDISLGKENHQLPAVNSIDGGGFPTDYLYITENVETSYLHINRVITSLQSCTCDDNCASSKCACCRSSVTCWYDKEGKLIEELNFQETPFIFECNRACRCWSSCNNRVVQHGMSARVQLFKTSDRGWGCRSVLDIAKGSFICEYIGELISDSDADSREDDSYLFDLDNRDGETYCIDARRYGNVSRFINHLCEPNIVPVKVFIDHQDLRFPRICLFASRDIAAGEELGFDYGEKFWMIKWKQFTCACGSPKCKYSSDVIHKTIADYNKRFVESDAPPQ